MPEQASAKICVVCGQDCANTPRMKDTHGRYYCKACYGQAVARRQSASNVPSPPPPLPPPHVHSPADTARSKAAKYHDDPNDVGAYGLEAPAAKSRSAQPPGRPAAPTASGSGSARPPAPPSAALLARAPAQAHTLAHAHAGGRSNQPIAPLPDPSAPPVICESCERPLPPVTIVCIDCGINVNNGRSNQTAEIGNIERIYEHARGILWFASWVLLLGALPVASEAHGPYKPWALRFIAVLTVVTTMSMWFFEWTGSTQMRVLKNQFHWMGEAKPDAEHIEMFYQVTSFGDYKAFEAKKRELRDAVPPEELSHAALQALPPSKRCFGEFYFWQLLTCAFLHGGFLHLAGNMIFLLVFGSRINALIGNIGMLMVYPLLAFASGVPEMFAMANEQPTYGLGASGAIQGLAGMYLVLFPVSKVHVALFIRPVILLLGFFRWQGMWLVLLYFGIDLASTIAGSEDGVAHWAQMGGLGAGALLALIQLFTRAVNARGKDLVSVLLGRHAWALLGKPSQWLSKPEGEGWLTRVRVIPKSQWQDA